MASTGEASRVDAVLERIAPFRTAVVMIGLAGLLLFAFQLPAARPHVAHGLIYGLGPLVVLLAWTRVRDGSAALSLSWLLVGGLACVAAAYAAHHGIAPGAPMAEVNLTSVGEVAELPILDDGAAFRLRVQGDPEGRQRDSARVPYLLYVSRGEANLRLRGELYREVRQESARGGPPERTVSLHRTELHDTSLSGRGPAAVSLLSVESLKGPLTVALFVPFGLGSSWLGLLAVLLLVTLALEVVSARAHAWTPLTAVTGLSLVLGEYVALRYDVDRPLITFLGGAVFAGVVGGVGGTAIGLGANWVAIRVTRGNSS